MLILDRCASSTAWRRRLWIIAVLANLTAIQRVVYTYVELKKGWAREPRRPIRERGGPAVTEVSHSIFDARADACGGGSEPWNFTAYLWREAAPRRLRRA